MPYRSLPLACALGAALLVGVAGCDSFEHAPPPAPGAPGASPKLRHWDLVAPPAPRGHAAMMTDSVDFIVTFSDAVGDPEAAAEELFHAHEVVRRAYYRDAIEGVAVTAPAGRLGEVLAMLVASDSVAFVEPDLPITRPAAGVQYVTATDLARLYPATAWNGAQVLPWTVRQVEGDRSWTRSGDGSGEVDVDVYVIDGPVVHDDLRVVERVRLLRAGVAQGSPLHGTHIAGIIGAVDDANGAVGVAPGVRIHAIEVLDAAGTTTLSALLSAVDLIVARKRAAPARPLVASMSIGADIGTTALNALDEAVARAVEAGVVFVVSAGNDGGDAATYSPAHAPGVIAVGAVDLSDAFAPFSNRGPAVRILAPGVDVVSLGDGHRYAILSGTSMATPHVAGAAALVLARRPGASPAAVLAELVRTGKNARHVPSGTPRVRVNVRQL